MKKLLCVGCAVALAFCAKAAVFDLNGVDKEVTSLSEYPDGFTNTSDTQATLTLVIGEDVTYAGPISGNLKLVKRGARDLTINTANTFTGGTEICLGRLIVGAAGALGDGEVYVESDCCQSFTYADQSKLSALAINCDSFANAIRTSAWTGTTPNWPSTKIANYNLQVMKKTTVLSDITGGDLSVTLAQQRQVNASGDATWAAGVTFSGQINMAGTVFHCSAQQITYTGPVRCKLMSNTSSFWSHTISLNHNDNHIGTYYQGIDNLVIWGGADALHGETVFKGSSSWDKWQNVCSFNMGRANQTIDHFVKQGIGSQPGPGYKNYYTPNYIWSNSDTPVTLTMRATDSSEFEWAVLNAVTLCWYPTNSSYKMSCVADRNSPTMGTIVVSNGVFELTGAYTFSNVTAVTVCEGATFENNSTSPKALMSVKTVRVDKGGSFKMGRADAMTTANVTFNLDTDSTVEIPDDCAIDVSAICFAGNGLPVGTYTGKDSTTPGATPIPQLKGAGTVYVLSSPKADVVEATWTDGAGDKAFETTGNWNNPAVAGRFGDGIINATFASAGSEAVVTGVEALNKMTFNGGVPSFTLTKGNDAASIVLGAGGLAVTASAATVVTNEVPVTIAGSQDWSIGQNVKLCMTGGLCQAEAKSTLLNITGGFNDNRQLQLFGRGDAGTYAGRVDIKGNVAAVGDDPFGRAVDGVDGTITLYGGNAGKLLLGKKGGPITTITKPVKMSGAVAKTYLQLAYSDSGTTENKMTRVSFLGPVDFSKGSVFDMNGFNPHVIFAGGGKMLSDVSNYSGSMTVTNKPMELSFLNTHAGTLQLYLNVSSNRVDGFRVANPTWDNSYANDIYFGADWALYEGNTELYLQFHWGNNRYYGSTIQLNGHDQRIGTLSSRLDKPAKAEYPPTDLTPIGNTQITSTQPATLYVNQTTDAAMIIPFTGKAALCKEGAASLMISNVACTATSPLTVAGGTLELFDASWKNATGVTVTAQEGDATLKLSTKLAAANVPANKFFTKKAFGLVMTDGEGTARLDLAEGVFETADTFVLNGKAMSGGCTYGSSASPADVKDDVHFAGKGVVRVARPSGVVLIFR